MAVLIQCQNCEKYFKRDNKNHVCKPPSTLVIKLKSMIENLEIIADEIDPNRKFENETVKHIDAAQKLLKKAVFLENLKLSR